MILKIGKKRLRIKDCRGLSSISGLMFNSMKKIDGALIYGANIWMPFVKTDLDLLFLDRSYKIVDVQRAVPATLNTKTWKIYSSKRARYCLELKAGLVRARKGMKLSGLGRN